MKYYTALCLIIVSLIFTACDEENNTSCDKVTATNGYNVIKMFTHDGVTMYKYYDPDTKASVYFSKPSSLVNNVHDVREGKYHRQVNSITISAGLAPDIQMQGEMPKAVEQKTNEQKLIMERLQSNMLELREDQKKLLEMYKE